MQRNRRLRLIVALCSMTLFGCGQEEIRSYDAPKQQVAEKVKERMLAALVPHGEQMWVLKMQGPEAAVAEHKTDFDSVLSSLHFDGASAKPITWKTPPGWKDEPGDQMRFATLRLESDEKVALAISQLPASSILANVNRWRGQLSLAPIEQAELSKVTSTVKVDGADAIVVDFTGTSTGGRKMPPFAGHPAIPRAGGTNDPGGREKPASGELTYTTPPGWKEAAPRPPRVASFTVGEGSRAADVSVMSFPGEVGGQAANIDRWRGQVGLGSADAEQLKKDVHEIEVNGEKGYYADLADPAKGTTGPRILGVGLPHGGSTWFFKMIGPSDVVGPQKAAFEAFVKSVKFNGSTGGRP
jgi:hypothetical protein